MDEVALVTCTPPLSAAFRLIVFGRLESIAAAATQ
jgi:sortase (surface protein transpeptidase)